MTNSARLSAVLLAAAVSGMALGGTAAADVPIVLTGCVMPASGADRYYVKDVAATGAPNIPRTAFFRFDDDDDLSLAPFVGRLVEIRGTADLDEPDEADVRIELERERTTTTTTTTTTVTGEPATIVKMDSPLWGGTLREVEVAAEVPSYEFDIEAVRVLPGTCR